MANLSPLHTVTKVRNLRVPGDDLFVSCISYEDRTVNSFRKLHTSYRAEGFVLFTMKEYEKNENLVAHDREISQILQSRGAQVVRVKPSIADPISALESFVRSVRRSEIWKAVEVVTIDISTFPRHILMGLLRYLRQTERKKVRILYTAPEIYATQIGEKMTWGIRKVAPLPFFSGTPISGRPKVLAIFMGFESERAFFLWEKHQPSRTILFLGKPAYRNSWELMSRYRHQEIMGEHNVSVREVSASDYSETYRELNAIYLKYGKDHNISIAPLGTKLQLLGIYLHAVEHPDVQLTYATVEHYNTKNYSKGIEKLYECRDF